MSGTIWIPPHQCDHQLLGDIRTARQQRHLLHLWWLGQSGFLIQWEGRHLLLDPYLSDSLTRKYAGTDKPHVRISPLIIEPQRLDFIDLVTSSHNHTDHLDGETLQALLEVNPDLMIVVPAANQDFAAERLRVTRQRLTPIDDGSSVSHAGFRLHAIPSAHETVERDERGRCRYLGYVIQCGPWTIYHSGDTVWYEGLVDRLRGWSIDLALLPINGRLASRRVAGNLWGHEAAQLAQEIGARLVIPCHYHLFAFNSVEPDEFVEAATARQQPFRVLRLGERLSWAP